MQPRLSRSATESMVAGVSGGLAEYFNIDPVIVRLIFVLVTLTSGLGIPVYILLWIIMPKATIGQQQQTFQEGLQNFGQEASRFGQEFGEEAAKFGREVLRQNQGQGQGQARSGSPGVGTQTPSPTEYRFDPLTGQPISPDDPTTGRTVNLNVPQAQLPAQYPNQPQMRRSRNWNVLGTILIGIGALVILEQFGIDMSLVFPALLIVAGVILMRRRR